MALPKIIFTEKELASHKDYVNNKIDGLKGYRKKFQSSFWQHDYLTYLIDNIETIATSENIEGLKATLDGIHPFSEKKYEKCGCKKDNGKCELECEKLFSGTLQAILAYKHSTLIKYFLYNGNKVCYICNAQYTISAQKDYKTNYLGRYKFKKKYSPITNTHVVQHRNKAKFQLDHYYPKSLYPGLSISLHNLFPICASCNQVKLNSLLDISKLHTNYKFELGESSIYEFYKTQDNKFLTLHISDFGTDGLVEKFDLKGIYDNHIDHVEELLVRKVKYSESYRKALISKHSTIVPTFTSIEDRLIVGTYDKNEGIYKRPLSKLLQDINDQLDGYVS